jgi:uncharacterized SAM-binding protein YcdF (DUF218 family)
LALLLLTLGALARRIAPASNTDRQRFDVIVVLGSPAKSDGRPSAEIISRVTEAVHEYERGVAPRLILSGGAAHNEFVEAEVMARLARSMGVPDSALVTEARALDTIQNARNSVEIMQRSAWKSAEVVTVPGHLPRAGMIFDRLPVEWRMHPAPPLAEDGPLYRTVVELLEDYKTARYLLWSRWTEEWQPGTE